MDTHDVVVGMQRACAGGLGGLDGDGARQGFDGSIGGQAAPVTDRV
jgi:hypothetical protein